MRSYKETISPSFILGFCAGIFHAKNVLLLPPKKMTFDLWHSREYLLTSSIPAAGKDWSHLCLFYKLLNYLYISYVVCWSLIPWRGEEEVVIQLEWNIFIDDYVVYDARVCLRWVHVTLKVVCGAPSPPALMISRARLRVFWVMLKLLLAADRQKRGDSCFCCQMI